MNNLKSLFKDVEDKWMDILFNYCKEQFKKVGLQSHNHLHSLRVWLNAKELFKELQKYKIDITLNDLEKTIHSIFFHDIGMVKTIEAEHGVISKQMYELFFHNNKPKKIEGFDEVSDAIQKHDEKEYKSWVYHKNTPQKDVLSVLCVSDDLDAFGAIGVFRYAEIYLLRGTSIKDLPQEVIRNLDSRYQNFCNLYSHLDSFTKKQKTRYGLTREFYKDLEKELKEKQYSKKTELGPVGVMNIMMREFIEGNTSIFEISDKVIRSSNDEYVIKFFKQFKKEVESSNKYMLR